MPDHVLGALLAVVIFPLVIWIPGALLAYALNLLDFRQCSPAGRLAIGLVVSFCLAPITSYLVARAGGFGAAFVFYGLIWTTAAALLGFRARDQVMAAARDALSHRRAVLLVLAWIAFCILWEVDFVTRTEVYRNLNVMDAVAHVAFTNALTRTGVPPANPFVYPGHPVTLFYYYGWYVVCSLVDQIGGSVVTARAAVQAGTVYVGLGLAALVAIYCELSGTGITAGRRRPRAGLVIALFAVTGLDILPYGLQWALKILIGKGPGAGLSLEHWNEQVTAWFGAVLMSPHHPAATVISMTAALLIALELKRDPVWDRRRIGACVTLGFAFASSAVTSVYVTLAFAAGLLLFLIIALVRRWRGLIGFVLASGAIALALYIPFALDLRAGTHREGFPLALTIRAFTPIDYWLPSILHFLKTTPAAVYGLRFVFLPVNYFLELGFFAVGAFFYWRWRRSLNEPLERGEWLFLSLTIGSVTLCTFVESVIRWNDLGWRGFLIAQFVLLFWTAPVAEALFRRSESPLLPVRARLLVWACVVIGVLGTAGEMINFRFRPTEPEGPITVDSREAYSWIDAHEPSNAVLLLNPDEYIEFFNSLYGYRQVICAGRELSHLYLDAGAAETLLDDSIRFYSHDLSATQIADFTHRYHADVVVVTSADPVWKNGSSWVWKSHPVFANSTVRIFNSRELAGGKVNAREKEKKVSSRNT